MKTPLVDSLGLNVLEYIKGPGCISEGYINAEDLERFLEKCPEAFANDTDKGWGEYVPGRDTKKCRIICVQEIKPKSIEEKILDLMNDYTKPASQVLSEIRYIIESSKGVL